MTKTADDAIALDRVNQLLSILRNPQPPTSVIAMRPGAKNGTIIIGHVTTNADHVIDNAGEIDFVGMGRVEHQVDTVSDARMAMVLEEVRRLLEEASRGKEDPSRAERLRLTVKSWGDALGPWATPILLALQGHALGH
jgi:hypothetical protein